MPTKRTRRPVTHLALAERVRLDTDPVPTPEGCWRWTGPRNEHGYGWLRPYLGGRRVPVRAHRASWCLYHWGPDLTYTDVLLLPTTLSVCHHCDHPWCVNPEHLFLAPQEMNRHDAALKGRTIRSQLSLSDIPTIRADYAGGGWTYLALARRYGVTLTTIAKLVARKTYKHVP